MQFNITYGSGVTSQSAAFQAIFGAAVNAAVQFYEHAFTNNVTVNITFDWQPLGPGIAAENNFPLQGYDSYASIRTALINSERSADDITAYNTLPATTDPTGSNTFALTAPQARALGFSANFGTDDSVTLGSNLSWTFDPNNRAVAGEYDAIGALEHEISEGVFGRIGDLNLDGFYTPLDLFRYSSAGVRDFSPNNADYFSIDGQHLLREFNINGTFGGDVSDWYPAIQGDSYGDAYQDTVGQVTPTDVRELDILGWNRAPAPVDDFTGDAVSAVLFHDPNTGDTAYLAMNGGQGTRHDLGNSPSGYNIVGTGDFNGDRTADILYRNPTTGDVEYSAMPLGGGSGTWVDLGTPSAAYNVVGVGDFNGDGASDILFQNPTTGDVGYSLMNGGHFGTWHGIGTTSYSVVGVGDYTGNGISDVLYQNSTGDIGYYQVSNGTWHDIGTTAYGVIASGDFNGDGTSDILFRSNTTGDIGYLAMPLGGGAGTWHDVGVPASGYQLVAVGDYNGDGTTDLLYRNATTGDTGYAAMPFGGGPPIWHDIGSYYSTYTVINDGSDNGVAVGDAGGSGQASAGSGTGQAVVTGGFGDDPNDRKSNGAGGAGMAAPTVLGQLAPASGAEDLALPSMTGPLLYTSTLSAFGSSAIGTLADAGAQGLGGSSSLHHLVTF